MAYSVELRSQSQILGDLVRTILANTDLSDISPGSSTATLLEGIATSDYQISISALKILENSALESLEGAALDKKAVSIRLPNGIGGLGRLPASQTSGNVTIGSGFAKISSKLYAGKPAPFSGSRRLFLEDASGLTPTGNLYIGRGTVSRFEGPIAYTSVTNNGSFWTVELASPLTKNHLTSDLVVLAQGGNRVVAAGTIVQVPGSSNAPAISFSVNSTVTIPDGESETTALVTCTQFGEIGNALAGAVKSFASAPFTGATVTNPTSYNNGRSTENDEDLRKRIKNYPATLSRGTVTAIKAAIQGLDDPDTGRTITSSSVIEPTESGDSSKVYIDDGTALEPTFDPQAYEQLLQSASGQETQFRTAKFPITSAVILGSENAPYALREGLSLTVICDGVAETYTLTPANYSNLNAGTSYELVRDFNSQSNIVGFRTTNGGKNLAILDLSGNVEEMRIEPGELQQILGFPIATVRPIFVYVDNVIQSFRGHTATLSTQPYPWGLLASDLDQVRVIVDGVTQTITITNADFSEFSTNIASATLAQWATVLSRKVAGVKFTASGNVLVWTTYQTFSATGSLEIPTTRADGSAAGWVSDAKMWKSLGSGGVLSDVGDTKDFRFNRFTGEINFIKKPSVGSTIEIGSRTTRAEIESTVAPAGLFTLSPLPLTVGNSRMVVAFDGEYADRPVVIPVGATFTPTIPDASGASNVVRLFANDAGLFVNAQVDDWVYLVKDESSVPGWGAAIEGLYRLKAVGTNGFPVDQNYSNLVATTLSGSAEVVVTQLNHGFKTGARVSVTTAAAIGGISGANLSQALTTITVLNSTQWKYTAGAVASSTAAGTLATVVYNADTWVEFEISQEQAPDWTALLGIPQSVSLLMLNIFRSTTIPQVVNFGSAGATTTDTVVSIIQSQIASGSAVKRTPQQLTIRSNDFLVGTAAVLAVVGNAGNLFSKTIRSSIQAHIAYSPSSYAKSGGPVVTETFAPAAQSTGRSWRYFLSVDRTFTDVLDNAANPTIESPASAPDYPLGFEQMWLTGRYAGLTGRVYNNQVASPYAGILRAEGAIRAPYTQDTEQTNPDSFDRYANYGLRFSDLAITNKDRLVVEMDLDPIDRTVAIPMAKRALVQDMDAIAGAGPGQVISFRLKDPDDLDPLNSNLPRPFFDTQSVYRTYDFRDFRLLTKSVGLYRDFAAYSAYANGSLTVIPSGATGITDGDTVTISDGVAPVIFEFNGSGGVTPGNVAVAFTPGVAATGTLTAQAADAASGAVDAATFALNDGVNPTFTFELDSNASFLPGNIQVPFIAGTAATGTLTAGPADPVTGIADGDTFVVSDGVNPPVTFEFDTDSTVTPGNVAVTILATSTALQVKTAILAAFVGATIDVTAVSGPGTQVNLSNDTLGSAGNVAITELFANAVSLFPAGMSGGVNPDTAAAVRTAIITAINSTGIAITAAPGSGSTIDLTNDATGTAGNMTIVESFPNSGTLTPTGMTGGVNETTATAMRAALLAAISGSSLAITALNGPGTQILLVNDVAGPTGNVAISESLANGTLTPAGMAGGSLAVNTDRALVLRSTAMGAPTRLRLSIRYAVFPDQADIVISHTNQYRGESQLNLLATLPSSPLVPASTYNTGTYTVSVAPNGSTYAITFTGAGLNPGGQYSPGAILNVAGLSPLAGSYLIQSAGVGTVTVLAPGDGGVANGTIFSAIQFPLASWTVAPKTWQDLATAINAYLPENPVATAEALGTAFLGNPIQEATYITYPQPTPYAGTDMSGAFNFHSFDCKRSGNAGIFIYDSSNPNLNGIQATVQTEDSIFPTTTDAAGTTYSPIEEEVAIVPANSKSLTSWLNFNAASSLTILAAVEEIGSSSRIQISSRQDGSSGAVRVTGVTANTIESFVIGNSTLDGDASKLTILATDAQALVAGGLVAVENSTTTELLRPYRAVPAVETPYNTFNANTFFRPTNSIKYARQTANTARIVFYRFGTGTGQTEPLTSGDAITLTSLGGGLVQVSSAGGDLAARVGDMAYVKPTSAFPADVRCKSLSGSGVTAPASPEYLGYPVVHVNSDTSIIILAPNVTSFGVTNITSSTDLVFLPAVYNEKNVRTNHAEGAAFDTLGANMYILVKRLGGNMMSVWVQNSATEATDTMRLADMLVNTDDYATLGAGFDLANQGTFRVVAHNGRNHLIVYNPNGGKDELVDSTSLVDGGRGQRKWRVGPLPTSTRPIRIVDAESVRIGDRLRISAPAGGSQWFPDTMIGSFEVLGLGFIGITQATGTLTAVAANPGTGIADGDIFTLNDGGVARTFEFDTTGSVAVGRVRVAIGPTDTAAAVKTAIIAAINSLGTAFKITAESGSGLTILLTNRTLSLAANTAITESLSNGQTLTPVGMSGAVADDGQIQSYVDINLPLAPVELVDGTGAPVNKFLVATNDSAIGFVEGTPYSVFRLVAGHSVNPLNTEQANVFLLPKAGSGKIAETFGSKVTALFKTGFEQRTFQGIDGYKTFAGLVREAHRVIDGLPSNPVLFPGVKAMGTVVEVLPPLVRSIEADLQVRPKDGVTLNSISEVVRSTVASYINKLGVGQPVILAEIVRIVQGLPGVFSVTVLAMRPAPFDDRVVVSDLEKPFVLNASTDINIG